MGKWVNRTWYRHTVEYLFRKEEDSDIVYNIGEP